MPGFRRPVSSFVGTIIEPAVQFRQRHARGDESLGQPARRSQWRRVQLALDAQEGGAGGSAKRTRGAAL